MTIYQLKKPCFILDPAPWDGGEDIPHFDTRAEAAQALTELRLDREPDLADAPAVEVRSLPDPCWVAECDAPDGPEGTCSDTLGDEDEGPACLHFADLDELLAWLPCQGWVRAGADGALCREHAPETSGQRPPTPAQLEDAGQIPLPGVVS